MVAALARPGRARKAIVNDPVWRGYFVAAGMAVAVNPEWGNFSVDWWWHLCCRQCSIRAMCFYV